MLLLTRLKIAISAGVDRLKRVTVVPGEPLYGDRGSEAHEQSSQTLRTLCSSGG